MLSDFWSDYVDVGWPWSSCIFPNDIQFITLAQVNRFTIFFAIAAFGGRESTRTDEEHRKSSRSQDSILTDYRFSSSPSRHLLWLFSRLSSAGVGPVIAAFVTNKASWRWNMRVQAILVAVVLIFVILFVPETNRSVLEARANKVKRKKGALFLERLYGPWKYLIDPVSFSVCLYLSILYGVSFLAIRRQANFDQSLKKHFLSRLSIFLSRFSMDSSESFPTFSKVSEASLRNLLDWSSSLWSSVSWRQVWSSSSLNSGTTRS